MLPLGCMPFVLFHSPMPASLPAPHHPIVSRISVGEDLLPRPDVPVYYITKSDSVVNFSVDSSVALSGIFERWNATLSFDSPDVTTGQIDMILESASVNTGSAFKDNRLRSKDFFDSKENPSIIFHSTRLIQTGFGSFAVMGVFTIHGVSHPQLLKLTVSLDETGSGVMLASMAFNRKEFGMSREIPFVRIADRVEVTADLKVRRISGPALVFKQ
jgi:polyisoprenoid-binding protein YceI